MKLFTDQLEVITLPTGCCWYNKNKFNLAPISKTVSEFCRKWICFPRWTSQSIWAMARVRDLKLHSVNRLVMEWKIKYVTNRYFTKSYYHQNDQSEKCLLPHAVLSAIMGSCSSNLRSLMFAINVKTTSFIYDHNSWKPLT